MSNKFQINDIVSINNKPGINWIVQGRTSEIVNNNGLQIAVMGNMYTVYNELQTPMHAVVYEGDLILVERK